MEVTTETPRRKDFQQASSRVIEAWGHFGGKVGDKVDENQLQAVLRAGYGYISPAKRYSEESGLPSPTVPTELEEVLEKAQNLETSEGIRAAISFFNGRMKELNQWSKHLYGRLLEEGAPPVEPLPFAIGITGNLEGTRRQQESEVRRQRRTIGEAIGILNEKLEPPRTRIRKTPL